MHLATTATFTAIVTDLPNAMATSPLLLVSSVSKLSRGLTVFCQQCQCCYLE